MEQNQDDRELFGIRMRELRVMFDNADDEIKKQIVIDVGSLLDTLDELVFVKCTSTVDETHQQEDLRKYSVTVIYAYQFNQIVEVNARNEDHAQELALSQFKCDWDQSEELEEFHSLEIESL